MSNDFIDPHLEILHRCGHTSYCETWRLTETEIALKAEQDCWECVKQAKYKQAAAQSTGLPALIGTDKQIVWATQLRIELLRRINNWLSGKGCLALNEQGNLAGNQTEEQLAATAASIYGRS
jgi:hypothetical protein